MLSKRFFFTKQIFFDKLFVAMPVIKSAIKKAKQDEKARELNRGLKDEFRKASKEVRKLIFSGNIKEAQKALDLAYSKLDKAAKRNVIHKNNASRRKSRLAALLPKKENKK